MWIVTWMVVSAFLVGCPAPEPVCNEYGLCPRTNGTLAVACYETSTKPMQKEFGSQEAAEAFIANGKKHECIQIDGMTVHMGNNTCARDFKIAQVR